MTTGRYSVRAPGIEGYRKDDIVKVRPRVRSKRTTAIRLTEDAQTAPSGWLRLRGVRVRQSDHAMLSNVARCELRRGYYYVEADRVWLVKRDPRPELVL